MKRVLIPAAVLGAAILTFAVVNATAGSSRSREGGRIHVIEHATSDAVTNGTADDSAGNILTFANGVFDSSDTKKVGTDQGYCVRIEVGKSWECNWTTFLPGGQITVEGPFLDTGDSTVAITGGTGAYRNVRGSMQLKYHNPAGTEFDFVFNLIG
ncbi:MAG TPA: allene oxide cyclase family protein [Gaiellaceae bacterium]